MTPFTMKNSNQFFVTKSDEIFGTVCVEKAEAVDVPPTVNISRTNSNAVAPLSLKEPTPATFTSIGLCRYARTLIGKLGKFTRGNKPRPYGIRTWASLIPADIRKMREK
jgi:hypothetical protein